MSDQLFFETQPLSKVFKINTLSVMPNRQPKDLWHHHSIPAFDEIGDSVLEYGEDIESNKTQIVNPSVLVSKLNPRKSRVSLVLPKEQENHCCSTEFICYDPIDKTTVLSFWKHFFASNYFKTKLTKIAIGSTNSHTRAAPKATLNWDVPLVTKLESQKVAEILDTLDTQIRETEAIINKLQRVKKGLLHDLLTRGVDENGELRPSYQDAPELYKPSELGWIPKEWDAVNVGSQINIKHGFAFDGSLFTTVPSEYPLLVPGNFHRDGRLYFTQNNTKYFKGEYSNEYLLKPRDIVVVMTDLSPQTLILGRAAILDDTQYLLHNQRVGKIEFKCEDEWDKNFFVESLSQETLRRKIILTATGTTVRHTSPDRIYALDIAKPLIDEQRSISKIIENTWARLTEESDNLVKLKLQKSGLMDDLLTGKKCVTNLLNQQPLK